MNDNMLHVYARESVCLVCTSKYISERERERERASMYCMLTLVLFSSKCFLLGSGEGAGVLTECGLEYGVRVSGGKSISDRN